MSMFCAAFTAFFAVVALEQIPAGPHAYGPFTGVALFGLLSFVRHEHERRF